MRLNIDRDLVKQMVSGQLPNKSRHLDELTHELTIWSCDTGQWLSCFDSCQLTILWMSNIQDVDLPRHAWDTPSSLLMVSPTLPLQSVDAYVSSVNHVTTKRKEVDHIPWVWGTVPEPRYDWDQFPHTDIAKVILNQLLSTAVFSRSILETYVVILISCLFFSNYRNEYKLRRAIMLVLHRGRKKLSWFLSSLPWETFPWNWVHVS